MFNNQVSTYVTASITAAGVLGGAYYAYQLYQEQHPKLPEKWEQVGVLKNIFVYPIKSCGRIELEKAECSILGLKDGWLRDRILMVVDDKNNFITARGYPELLTVTPSIKSSVLTLKHPDMEPVHINLAEVVAQQKPVPSQVWRVPVPVFECGYEPNEWFSRLIDRSSMKYSLVYYASQKSRPYRAHVNGYYKFKKNDTAALHDEIGFNLINEASVDELNTRLTECQVTEKNFRPNFVLTGAKAYAEDNWKFLKIGENIFEIIKPCTRCVLTTIDPETGVRNSKTEPLTTLKSYRQVEDPRERKMTGSSPRMGIQMALRTQPGGMISVNEPIYVAY
ncbi:unnamed protein product [Chrysodeixis includens]|uniref:MOSC domain-containing protein n=1 Tax=Chrysodeixis includens TaxID=689277 RepID=A0A9N8L6E6_CHRIL|nr:unnamed protein product [Chrysodeixis includens]